MSCSCADSVIVVWCCCNFPKHLPTVLFMFEILLGVFLLVSTLRKPSVETSLPEISSCLQSLHTTSAQISSILGFFPSHIFTVSFKVSFAEETFAFAEDVLAWASKCIWCSRQNIFCLRLILEKYFMKQGMYCVRTVYLKKDKLYLGDFFL